MTNKKKKPIFNNPTEVEWFVKTEKDKNCSYGYHCMIDGKVFNSIDSQGNEFTFYPNIATVLFGRTLEEKMANAHLISASREMYAALKEIHKSLMEGKKVNGSFCITMALLKAILEKSEKAMKKAEGK